MELNSETAADSEKGSRDQVVQALHLAEAIVKKAGGEFRFQESPFELILQLPINAEIRTDSVRALSLPAES
jgi:hypothetical protein